MTIPPAPGYPPPVPLRPRRKKWPWIIGGFLALGVVFVIVAAVVAIGRTTATTAAASPCQDKAQHPPCAGPNGAWIRADGTTGLAIEQTPTTPVQAASTEPALPEPTAKDYTIDLAVVSKQCFGSAGCNVVVEPKLNANGASTLLWNCDLTYSISGDDSGELIETAYNDGGTQYRINRTVMSTKNSKVVPKATVTSVSCRKP
jgi:hypothetical protein